jgi:hypothetical protein
LRPSSVPIVVVWMNCYEYLEELGLFVFE